MRMFRNNKQFAVAVIDPQFVKIAHAVWTGVGHIPALHTFVPADCKLQITLAHDFEGEIVIGGALRVYEKDGNTWTYQWSQAVEAARSGSGMITLKYSDENLADVFILSVVDDEGRIDVSAGELAHQDLKLLPAPASQ
jgi:hypothetical protein